MVIAAVLADVDHCHGRAESAVGRAGVLLYRRYAALEQSHDRAGAGLRSTVDGAWTLRVDAVVAQRGGAGAAVADVHPVDAHWDRMLLSSRARAQCGEGEVHLTVCNARQRQCCWAGDRHGGTDGLILAADALHGHARESELGECRPALWQVDARIFVSIAAEESDPRLQGGLGLIRQARGGGGRLALGEEGRCRPRVRRGRTPTAAVTAGAARGRLSRAAARRGAERHRGEGRGGAAAPCALARGSGLDVHSGWCLPVLVAKYFGLASLVLPIPAPRA